MTTYDAVVVGAGPNGLSAAVTLAEAGRHVLVLEAADVIGGGTRTEELTRPGFRHDVCSAVHPLGAASPYLSTLPLGQYGLRWLHPEVPLAHPLDGGRAAVLHRSLDATAAALGVDERAYRRAVGPLVERWDDLAPALLGPLLRVPKHPLLLARFGMRAALPAAALAATLATDEAKALVAGCAGHAILPLHRPLTASFGLLLAASAHAVGWPVAGGGSQALADALAAHLGTLGGEIRTGTAVRSLSDVPASRVVLFDLAPSQVAAIAGDALPPSFRARLTRFRHGPGAWKVDYALDGPVPWTNADCRRAGTLHVGGTLAEIAAAERAVASGRTPERPFVLVAQQSVVDPSRAPAGKHTLWAYCHVPRGSTVDMTAAIEDQIERFAPGWRDFVLARHVAGPAWFEQHNPAYVGGDIAGGAHTGLQLALRPTRRTYRTPNERLFLCSASTPPGAGAHGMCGHHAALTALRTTLC
jgi:phytoene dehydrogenase-like protein